MCVLESINMEWKNESCKMRQCKLASKSTHDAGSKISPKFKYFAYQHIFLATVQLQLQLFQQCAAHNSTSHQPLSRHVGDTRGSAKTQAMHNALTVSDLSAAAVVKSSLCASGVISYLQWPYSLRRHTNLRYALPIRLN